MPAFVDAALTFPTVLFTFLLVVVVGYWLVVMFVGGDADLDGVQLPLGLGGIPATVAFSLFVALSWFVSLAGVVLLGHGPLVLGAALAAGWVGTKALIIPMRRLFPEQREPSRHDFVGRRCVVRTGRADAAFGQAEVTAPDGSSAVVQVRTTGGDVLTRGQAALIFDYDAEGEFFWVMEDHS
ncbi:hypothetical protein [Nonomuraea africana]|uniref:DUF1449 family protein n=1 Tax=Nonomuraea africana TaxID=46171 RepID=A0ABR9KQF5_9ACTN|nr:hypothetical protein [Nonomuraea africana]MBE1564257.1 hypothetical protein [Nonomuraea africana]